MSKPTSSCTPARPPSSPPSSSPRGSPTGNLSTGMVGQPRFYPCLVIMSLWAVAAISTVIFMSVFKSEVTCSTTAIYMFNSILQDFASRLNFKIAPHVEFQIIAVVGIVINFLFCYFWENFLLDGLLFQVGLLFAGECKPSFSRKCCHGTKRRSEDQTLSSNTWRGEKETWPLWHFISIQRVVQQLCLATSWQE